MNCQEQINKNLNGILNLLVFLVNEKFLNSVHELHVQSLIIPLIPIIP